MSDSFESAVRDWQKTLDKLGEDGIKVASAGVGAAVNVLAGAAKDAAIGGIKKEVGGYIKVIGSTVIGRAGLMVFPRKGELVDGRDPHGAYIDYGTKYIVARHLIARAMVAARARASAAMRSASQRKLNQLKGSKS